WIFPAYLKGFTCLRADYCSCGGIGTALLLCHGCVYVSWHMRKPEDKLRTRMAEKSLESTRLQA
ncbi:hypothetical protein AVEN_169524-1, partial [Araneus ventricosus]